MLDKQRVIDIALSQVGYHEKASWDDLDSFNGNSGSANYNKYSRDLAEYHYYNSSKRGVAWCDIFVDWCFATAYGAETGHKMLYQPLRSSGAGCRYSREFFAAHKALYTAPEVGDQVFFWPADHKEGDSIVQHTGLVIKIENNRVFTVEGNSNDKVAKHSYPLSYQRFAGFGRPNWDIGGGGSTAPSPGKDDEHMSEKCVVRANNGKPVKVRKTPSQSAVVLDNLPCGTVVEAGIAIDGWCRIVYNGEKVGYMMSQFLIPENENVATDAYPEYTTNLSPEQYNKLCEARDILISIVGMG